jgi:hypothetical protein
MRDVSSDLSSNLVGHFQLGAEIGTGGMGVVYLARDVTLDRDVAVKTLNDRHGADPTASQRFQVEAKITGQLAHPGIPAVHELGTLPDGRPFLAMKLVKGKTLRALLQERSDPGQERGRFIAVFEQICQALGYAHAHRVIHRDLKPGNVMVGAHGEVQVMDWGLAKVLREQVHSTEAGDSDSLTTNPGGTVIDTPDAIGSRTKTGEVIGTLAYMPPEQAGGQIRSLDPRSDVFGLGAILCEILTGHPPYQGKSVNEVRLQAVRGELGDIFIRLEQCGAEPELTALCKRCLGFRQDERPADGAAVAAEVGRIRQAAEDRARQAGLERERALVRVEEQRKRRRVVQIASAMITTVLLAGLAASSWQMVRANRERDDKAKVLAQYETGVELLAGMLAGIDPNSEQKGDQPLYDQLRERAEKAADQLQAQIVADPLVEARLQTIMGNTLSELGSYVQAIEVLQRARATREEKLGADHPDTLTTLDILAQAYHAGGKLSEAIALFQQVRDARVEKLGADHPDTLFTLNNLAAAHDAAGKPLEAIAIYERARDLQVKKLGADHPDTLSTLNNLGVAYQAVGKLPEAIALFQQVRDARVQKLGAVHHQTLITLHNLAEAYKAAGKLPEAIALYQQVRDAEMKKLGTDHPSTLITLNNLAVAYEACGKLPEAIALYQQLRDAQVKKLGAEHPLTLTTLTNLASAYKDSGKLSEALPLFEEAAAEIRRQRFLHEHAGRIIVRTVIAYEAAKEWDRAETWERAWLAHLEEKGDTESLAYADELNGLGSNLLRQRRWSEAGTVLREALKLRQKQSTQAWTTFNSMSLLGGALLGQNKYVEAEPLLVEGYQGMQARAKSISLIGKIRLSEAAERLVELYRATKKDDEARKWQQTLTNIVGKLQEPVHDVGKGLTLKSQLDATTKTLAYQVRLQAGTLYVIAMSSADGKALAPSLALTDEENMVLAVSGQSGVDARITYRALRTAVYRIRTTSANDGQGAFTLTVEKKEEK